MCQVITIFQKKGLSENHLIHLQWQMLNSVRNSLFANLFL